MKRRIHKINILILKTKQRFRSKKHNGFTEEINKINKKKLRNSIDDDRIL